MFVEGNNLYSEKNTFEYFLLERKTFLLKIFVIYVKKKRNDHLIKPFHVKKLIVAEIHLIFMTHIVVLLIRCFTLHYIKNSFKWGFDY